MARSTAKVQTSSARKPQATGIMPAGASSDEEMEKGPEIYELNEEEAKADQTSQSPVKIDHIGKAKIIFKKKRSLEDNDFEIEMNDSSASSKVNTG